MATMLVISRRKGQRITIGDEIELVVTELHRSSVKLGISAPRGYAVLRGEVRDSIEVANRSALETDLDEALELTVHFNEARPGTTSPSQLLVPRQATGTDERQNQDEVPSPPEPQRRAGPEIIRRRPARSRSVARDDNGDGVKAS